MLVPVLTAVSDAVWEAELVASLGRGDLGVCVVRRCVDLPDLLATAATGQARAALLSADLRRLDRDALTRLAVAGVAVVGLVPPGQEQDEIRLRQLGLLHVLSTDATAQAISEAVLDAVVALSPARQELLGDPRQAMPGAADLEGFAELARPGPGRLVAVWGPIGAPGRTTVATGLASELADLGWPSLLVDGDVYGGVIAQLLGMLDEAPGLAAACRLANSGTLDAADLAGLCRQISPTLRVLTGIARPDRWPELRPAALEQVLALATGIAAVTVVDCGFSLEQDEELSYDTMAPRRNGATLQVLDQADDVLVVGTADPVGLHRLVRSLAELKDAVPGVQPRVVVNRLRGSAIPGDAAAEVRAALKRYAGVEALHVIPMDTAGIDAAVLAGKTLVEGATGSPARKAIRALATTMVGAPQQRSGRHRRRRLARA
jgi:Flp pilus assembly CpaE family ATPase